MNALNVESEFLMKRGVYTNQEAVGHMPIDYRTIDYRLSVSAFSQLPNNGSSGILHSHYGLAGRDSVDDL